MVSTIGGVFTIGVFSAVRLAFYRLGYEARSRAGQFLAIALLFVLICARLRGFSGRGHGPIQTPLAARVSR